MEGWKRSMIAAAAAAILAVGALSGCSREEQRHAQEAGREAGGQLRRAARQALRETREVVKKAAVAADDLALNALRISPARRRPALAAPFQT
jgi:hypothetical protein